MSLACDCNESGSNGIDSDCEDHTGKCTCKSGYTGKKCSQCDERYFKDESGKCKGNVTLLFPFM